MIVIFIDNLEDFVEFLKLKIIDSIFYEFKKDINHQDLTSKTEIILHFLAKIESNIVLFETKQLIDNPKNSNMDEKVINSLKNVFSKINPSLKLIKGKVREIFLSFSS